MRLVFAFGFDAPQPGPGRSWHMARRQESRLRDELRVRVDRWSEDVDAYETRRADEAAIGVRRREVCEVLVDEKETCLDEALRLTVAARLAGLEVDRVELWRVAVDAVGGSSWEGWCSTRVWVLQA